MVEKQAVFRIVEIERRSEVQQQQQQEGQANNGEHEIGSSNTEVGVRHTRLFRFALVRKRAVGDVLGARISLAVPLEGSSIAQSFSVMEQLGADLDSQLALSPLLLLKCTINEQVRFRSRSHRRLVGSANPSGAWRNSLVPFILTFYSHIDERFIQNMQQKRKKKLQIVLFQLLCLVKLLASCLATTCYTRSATALWTARECHYRFKHD